jgi:tetratricopeptide (TPR) repeat protein
MAKNCYQLAAFNSSSAGSSRSTFEEKSAARMCRGRGENGRSHFTRPFWRFAAQRSTPNSSRHATSLAGGFPFCSQKVSSGNSPQTMTPDEIQDSFSRAQKAELIGNFPYAEMLCANVLRGKPDEHRARLLLRRCQMARFRQKHGNYRPHLKIAGSGIFFSPKPSADALRDVEVAEASLKENPCEMTANQLLMHAAERLGWNEIEQLCRDVIAEGTPTVDNLIGKANGLRKQRKFGRAAEVLENAVKQFPGNLQLDKALRDAQAEKASQSGWETAKDFTDVLAPGQAAQANEAQKLAEAIEKDPQNVALVDKLIAVLEPRAEARTVLEWINYRRNIEENPHLRRKAFDLERRLGSLTLERELEELEHFAKEHPTDMDLRLALGSALLRQGDSKRAILQLQAARKHTKTTVRVEALTALAQAYDNVGLKELGARSRTQALEMAGEDEALKKEILYQMALSLDMQDKKEEARERWMELFELDAGFKDTADHVLPPTT